MRHSEDMPFFRVSSFTSFSFCFYWFSDSGPSDHGNWGYMLKKIGIARKLVIVNFYTLRGLLI